MTFAITHTFTNGTVANATQVNQNFTDITNEFNGSTNTATPAWNAWRHIETISPLTTTSGSVSFSSIPTGSSYNYLKLIGMWDDNAGGGDGTLAMQINGTTTANYMGGYLDALNGVQNAFSGGLTGGYVARSRDSSAEATQFEITISNRDGSLKTWSGQGFNRGIFIAGGGLTSAASTAGQITSINLFPLSGRVLQIGSSFTLWGIKA